MSKLSFFRVEDQIERRASRWFMRNIDKNRRAMAKVYLKDEDNMEKIKKDFLKNHPDINEEYKQIKSKYKKIAIAAAVGTLAVGTLGATLHYTGQKPNEKEPETIENPVQDSVEKPVEDPVKGENEEQEMSFFDIIEDMKDTESRNAYIHKNTKDVIVEAYNAQNPENTITADDLQILILDENVLEKKDRLGNVTYERVAQDKIYEPEIAKSLVKLGGIYVFKINGETVATYDNNGNKLKDDTIKEEQNFFQGTVDFVKQSEKLKDSLQYRNTEGYIRDTETKYENMSNSLLDKSRFEEEVKHITDVENEI